LAPDFKKSALRSAGSHYPARLLWDRIDRYRQSGGFKWRPRLVVWICRVGGRAIGPQCGTAGNRFKRSDAGYHWMAGDCWTPGSELALFCFTPGHGRYRHQFFDSQPDCRHVCRCFGERARCRSQKRKDFNPPIRKRTDPPGGRQTKLGTGS